MQLDNHRHPIVDRTVQLIGETLATILGKIDQVERGKPAGPAPDPGLSLEDIRYSPERGLLTARIHNVGSLPIRKVKVAFYNGAPADGNRISVQQIPNLEAPNDLEPRSVTVGVRYQIEKPTDIYVVIDPEHEIGNEITTFNNVAHRRLTATKVNEEPATVKPLPRGGRGRGR